MLSQQVGVLFQCVRQGGKDYSGPFERRIQELRRQHGLVGENDPAGRIREFSRTRQTEGSSEKSGATT